MIEVLGVRSNSNRPMRWALRWAMALLLAAFALVTGPTVGLAKKPKCLEVDKRVVRSGLGAFKHIVILKSGCKDALSCHVRTNANPEGVQARVPAGKTVELITHTASPAADFEVQVDCK